MAQSLARTLKRWEVAFRTSWGRDVSTPLGRAVAATFSANGAVTLIDTILDHCAAARDAGVDAIEHTRAPVDVEPGLCVAVGFEQVDEETRAGQVDAADIVLILRKSLGNVSF